MSENGKNSDSFFPVYRVRNAEVSLNCPGVVPVCLLNQVVKCCGYWNPNSSAISAIVLSEASKVFLATSSVFR